MLLLFFFFFFFFFFFLVVVVFSFSFRHWYLAFISINNIMTCISSSAVSDIQSPSWCVLSTGELNAYCLLTLVHGQGRNIKTSPKSSPKVSPKNSPRSSPKLRKSPSRSASLDSGDVLRSQPARGSGDPKWNEEFQL